MKNDANSYLDPVMGAGSATEASSLICSYLLFIFLFYHLLPSYFALVGCPELPTDEIGRIGALTVSVGGLVNLVSQRRLVKQQNGWRVKSFLSFLYSRKARVILGFFITFTFLPIGVYVVTKVASLRDLYLMSCGLMFFHFARWHREFAQGKSVRSEVIERDQDIPVRNPMPGKGRISDVLWFWICGAVLFTYLGSIILFFEMYPMQTVILGAAMAGGLAVAYFLRSSGDMD